MWIIPKNLPLSNFVQVMEGFISDSNEQSQICASLLLVRSKPSQLRTWSRKWKRDSWTQHLSGRILKPSQVKIFTDLLTSSLQASHVNRSVKPVQEKEMKIHDISFLSSNNPSLTCNRNSSSLKTSKESSVPNFLETSGPIQPEHPFCSISLENWKESVTEQRGTYSARLKSAHHTGANECLSWPTAATWDWKDTPGSSKERNGWMLGRIDQLPWAIYHYGPPAQANPSTNGSHRALLGSWATPRSCAAMAATFTEYGITRAKAGKNFSANLEAQIAQAHPVIGQKLNPRWVETLMNLPIGWTMPSCANPVTIEPMNCDCLETELCRQQLNELGECYIPNFLETAND